MPKIEKAERRERQQEKARRAMVVSNRNVGTISRIHDNVKRIKDGKGRKPK